MRGELLDKFGIFICDLEVSSLILFKEQSKPDKPNYGAYGDTGCHLHMHLCPKYKDGDEWGGTFQMNPGKTYLTDAEYAEMIEKIKANL